MRFTDTLVFLKNIVKFFVCTDSEVISKRKPNVNVNNVDLPVCARLPIPSVYD